MTRSDCDNFRRYYCITNYELIIILCNIVHTKRLSLKKLFDSTCYITHTPCNVRFICQIVDCRILQDKIVTVDNAAKKLLRTSIASDQIGNNCSSVPFDVNYFDVNEGSGLEVYSCSEDRTLVVFKNEAQVGSHSTKYKPSGVAIAPSGTVVAVGDVEVKKVSFL